jgi:hypothetical protein
MAIIGSDVVTGAYQLLGRPSQADLPYEDVLEAARDCVRGRHVDLKLAQRDHTTTIGPWVTPSAREMSSSGFVGGLANFIPVKVEWRYITESTASPLRQPRKAQVVSFESVAGLHETSIGETYVAFYDGFENIAFSANTTELALRQYRVVYEDMADVLATKASATYLPDIFVTLLKYETALLCLDQVRNPAFGDERERLRGVFTQQFMIWNDRFNKWRTTSFGQKKFKKQGFRRY